MKNEVLIYNRKPWRKVLYENLGYSDNYTDISFLEELRKNIRIEEVTQIDAICGVGCIMQQLCSVVLFGVIFYYLDNAFIMAGNVFLITIYGTILGYIAYVILFVNDSYIKTISRDFRTVMIFLAFGFILSPIMKTLTDTISTDTIYSMSVLMMFVYLIFFDYGIPAAIVSSSLSLNAAIFASVCLASRLSTPFHAFVLLTVAVDCFVLMPLLLSKLQRCPIFLLFLISVTYYALWTISECLAVVLFILSLFLTLLCPYLFIKWQHYKENLYGPWDEAIVQDLVE